MTSNTLTDSVDLTLFKRFVPMNGLPQKHLKDIAKHSKLIKVQPKTLIFKRGANLKEKVYLVAGEVDLCDYQFKIKRAHSDAEDMLKTSLNPSNPTHVAAVTTSTATLLVVDSDRLDLIMTWSQAGHYLVEDLEEDKQETNEDWMSDLLQSNLLQKIPPSHIQQLFMSFKQDNFRKGHQIIRQGDVGEYFYVLQSGTAQVFRTNDEGNEETLATLTAGRFFGEEALISDNPRNASVRMLTDGSCMKLDKATFNKLLKEPVLKVVSSKKVIAMQLEDPKIRIIDLRTQEEAQSEPLENVMQIPFTELRERMETLDEELTYITHSISGRRAELGAYLLSDAGLDAFVMKQ